MMSSHPVKAAAAAVAAALLAGQAAGVVARAAEGVAPAARDGSCSSGAHTLSTFGAHVYPDTGNGGYVSVHTDIHMVYDATANRFLPGNHVVLTDRATRCLTDFSVDFERRSSDHAAGPDLRVVSITVDGRPANFRFVQPTYPGDPNGQNDPDPLAHEASQRTPVGGPEHNPLPPACSPELTSTDPAKQDSQDGEQCPANKLVITPQHPIAQGSTYKVVVSYTGRPGVHHDGDGTTEGWFRAPDGAFVTTEPVASEDWMPLNDHPSAKPTYDFFDRVNAGKTVLCNGVLLSARPNPPDPEFPGGSTTWHWRETRPVASYLVENSIGDYHLTAHVGDDGIIFYQAQDAAISAAQQRQNRSIMERQPEITEFESQYNGPYPFASDGIVVGTPAVSFDEEMETMITFAGGTVDLSTLYHENMHQWWGDNVTESNYNLTFFKEGLATFAQALLIARHAPSFDQALIGVFDHFYRSKGGFWTQAPSNPTPFGLFNGDATYLRPAIAYIALRQILGPADFKQALRSVQRSFGGGDITESELEAAFHQWLPVRSRACSHRLDQFFAEWFDTAYPPGGGANRPHVTGPGLAGGGFYNAAGGCG
jgi:hypothetical protein